MAPHRRIPRRGPSIPPPAWGCGEPDCPKFRWQPVSAMGEYNHADVAMGDLEAHYAKAHPELEAEEVDGAAGLLVA